MNKRCEVAAIESPDGAGDLLGRADELLERAQSAAEHGPTGPED